MKVRISLDEKNYKSKPTDTETLKISNRIANYIQEIEVSNFAQFLVQPYGRSFAGSVFNNGYRKNAAWKSQQVFALDIDKGITIKNFLTKCRQLNLLPSFIYTTFRHTEKQERFRVVFVLDEIIEDIRVRNYIQLSLMKIFPETDKNTKDAARLMFGGKEIVYSSYENVIGVLDIYNSVCTVIRNGSNPSRDMRQYCKMVGIDMLNGYPKILVFNDKKDVLAYENNENIYNSLTKKCTGHNNNISCCVRNSHLNYLIYFNKDNTREYHFKNNESYNNTFNIDTGTAKKTLIRDFPFEDLFENCKLYREATQGKYWLYHNEMFGVMTNLLQIYGGSAKIKEIIDSRQEYSEKMQSWNTMKNQILKADYAPCRCDGFCPFINECVHCNNMIFQGKLFRGMILEKGERKLKPLYQAEKELKETFDEIINSDEKGIFIIKAPTGIGKTQLYIEACRNKNTTIAVPTHKLKNDVSDRLTKENISHFVVPELPELEIEKKQKLDRLYQIGSYSGANMYLKTLSEDNERVREYLNKLKMLSKIKNRIIITTHQKVLSYKDFNDTIIIDEDIIINAMFPMDSMLMGELVKISGTLMNNPALKAGSDLLNTIINELHKAPFDLVQETPSFFMLFAKQIENIIVNDNTLKTNVLGFLNSSFYVVKINKKGVMCVYFINKRTLPQNKKIIILSATINEKIAKKVFGSELHFYDIGNVEQRGEIYQIPFRSFSKSAIKKNYEGMEYIANELIKKYNPDSNIITYKEMFNDISNPEWNFFNTAGRNELTGKNLTVIGTPHVNPLRYYLFSTALGFKVRMEDSIMSFQPVIKGNYHFYFETFSNNDFLREIQFYMIESELEQTVGRARTLRNECRVLVLSNYPVSGAEFIHISQKEFQNKEKLS
jgi:DNA or RNA helicases of superfamily II